MKWELLGDSEIPLALRLIGDEEWACEHLVYRLLQKQKKKSLSPDSVWMGFEGDIPQGVVYVSHSGLLLPFFPFLDTHEKEPASRLLSLKKALSETMLRVYSIVGKAPYVLALEEVFGIRSGVWVDYHLMTRQKDAPLPKPPLPPSIRVRKGSLADMEGLLPLQIQYEKEEVWVRPEAVDPVKSRKDLELSLRNQIIYLAECEGRVVSKAGTNARGMKYDQIGGVFTEPARRRQGFAKVLMWHLLEDLKEQGKHSCLFVKIHNTPALSLYRSIDFHVRGAFRIHYL